MTDPHKSGERASVILDSHSHVSRAGSFDSIFLLSAPAAATIGCSYRSDALAFSYIPALTHFYHNLNPTRLLTLNISSALSYTSKTKKAEEQE